MLYSSIALAGLSGWCGSKEELKALLKLLRHSNIIFKDPEIRPTCAICSTVGSVVGGIISYGVVSQVFPNDTGVAATFAAGFIGGRLGSQLGGYFGGMLQSK